MTDRWPLKPQFAIIDDKMAVFMGADYKLLPIETADVFVRDAQRTLEKLRRQLWIAARLAE